MQRFYPLGQGNLAFIQHHSILSGKLINLKQDMHIEMHTSRRIIDVDAGNKARKELNSEKKQEEITVQL